MKTLLVNYRIAPSMDDGGVIVRRARKDWMCFGGHDGMKRTKCGKIIRKGDTYVEYVGETDAYSSGARYHVVCAQQQGLLEAVGIAAAFAVERVAETQQTPVCNEVNHRFLSGSCKYCPNCGVKLTA
jgi:hypothetical protein